MRRVLLAVAALSLFACPSSDDDDVLQSPTTTRCRAAPPPARDAGVRDGAVDQFEPDCDSCRQDGQRCNFSINCQPGSICNLSNDPLYDPAFEDETCVRIACQTSDECGGERRCDQVAKLCTNEPCNTDDACTDGQICADGRCTAPLAASDVARCEVTGESVSLSPGERVRLRGTAYTRCDEALPEVSLVWSSSDDAVVIEGDEAIGSDNAGVASVTASAGGVACDGAREVRSIGGAAPGKARVSVRTLGGQPLGGVRVVVDTAGGTNEATTDASGLAVVDSAGVPDRVSAIVPAGTAYDSVTVVSPGTNALDLYLNPATLLTEVGGFRGGLDTSGVRRLDVPIGFAGTPLVPNAGDFDFPFGLCGELIPTEVRAPELSLDTVADIPGGMIWGLGSNQFTRNAERCGTAGGDIGCFATLAREQDDSAWALGGYARLSSITPIANELSELFGGGNGENIASCDALLPLLGVVGELGAGEVGGLTFSAAPRVPVDNADCTNALGTDYTFDCRPDYARFTETVIPIESTGTAFGLVDVGTMPSSGGSCAPFTSVLAGRFTQQGRFVPVGFGLSLDSNRDCRPDESAVGPTGAIVPAGTVAFKTLEPEQPALLVMTTSGVGFGAGRVSGAWLRPERARARHEVSLMDHPRGSVTAATRSATIELPAGATHAELHFRAGDVAWSIWAPANAANTIQWGDVPGLSDLMVDDGVLVSVRAAKLTRAPWQALRFGAEEATFSSVSCEMEAGACAAE